MTWDFEHNIATNASKKALWALYSSVESWPIWDQGIENISLDGEFKEGAKGKIEPDRTIELEKEKKGRKKIVDHALVVTFRETEGMIAVITLFFASTIDKYFS